MMTLTAAARPSQHPESVTKKTKKQLPPHLVGDKVLAIKRLERAGIDWKTNTDVLAFNALVDFGIGILFDSLPHLRRFAERMDHEIERLRREAYGLKRSDPEPTAKNPLPGGVKDPGKISAARTLGFLRDDLHQQIVALDHRRASSRSKRSGELIRLQLAFAAERNWSRGVVAALRVFHGYEKSLSSADATVEQAIRRSKPPTKTGKKRRNT